MTILKVDGEIYPNGRASFKNIPQIGTTIVYKNFRSNGDYGKPWYDTTIKVIDIIYEYEEDWNSMYKETITIIGETISKIEIL